jgi:alkylated DNA repair protein (DNA oxidative demethylase)
MMEQQGFRYVSDLFSRDEADTLLMQVSTLPYKHDRMRVTFKRGYAAQFGYAYVSAGRKLTTAPPFPEFVIKLLEKAGVCTGAAVFDQCIITQYPPGAGIGWHCDAPCFGDCIMAVSLGAPARLQFRKTGSKDPSYELIVAPGSLYVMRGPTRWEFQHRVKPVKATRYSLTFRQVSTLAAQPLAKRNAMPRRRSTPEEGQ